MGTKNNPGKFDCYSKADPDEPMFVLLGRDPAASLLVGLWADIRERMGEEPDKIAEARACGKAMQDHFFDLGKYEKQEAALEALREEVRDLKLLTAKTAEMIRGLVRLAELREADQPGCEIWDDEGREALKTARDFGWGNNQNGRLP